MRPSPSGMAVAAGAVASALALAACQLTFSNPAERLRAGQVSGRTVADAQLGGTLIPTAGISISIKGSAFDQVTHDTGRFTLIPLPAGRHTLLFRQGTELALTRIVDVELGPDGQPDGVSLGDVAVPFAAAVRGNLVGAVGPFGGVMVDETTGLTAPAPGAFQMNVMSLGEHALKFGMVGAPGEEWVGGPVLVRLEETMQSSVLPLADVVVRHVTADTGRLRFRLVSLHPDLAPAAIQVTVTEQMRGPLPAADVPAPDAGGWVELDAPEGIYQVGIAAPPPLDAEVTAPLAATAIVMAGQVADLGSLYLVPPGIPAVAQYLCEAGEDCGKGGVCNAGSCGRGWNPMPAAPARVPLCPGAHDCAATDPCVDDTGTPGFCVQPGGVQYAVCLSCGRECTADGVSVAGSSPMCP